MYNNFILKQEIIMGMPSGFELFIIVAAIVLLFGGKKIPELMRGIGQGMKEFKSATKNEEEDEATDKKKIDELHLLLILLILITFNYWVL